MSTLKKVNAAQLMKLANQCPEDQGQGLIPEVVFAVLCEECLSSNRLNLEIEDNNFVLNGSDDKEDVHVSIVVPARRLNGEFVLKTMRDAKYEHTTWDINHPRLDYAFEKVTEEEVRRLLTKYLRLDKVCSYREVAICFRKVFGENSLRNFKETFPEPRSRVTV